MMNFVLQMMDFSLKMIDFLLQMMDFVLKMMDFAGFIEFRECVFIYTWWFFLWKWWFFPRKWRFFRWKWWFFWQVQGLLLEEWDRSRGLLREATRTARAAGELTILIYQSLACISLLNNHKLLVIQIDVNRVDGDTLRRVFAKHDTDGCSFMLFLCCFMYRFLLVCVLKMMNLSETATWTRWSLLSW